MVIARSVDFPTAEDGAWETALPWGTKSGVRVPDAAVANAMAAA